MIATILAEAGRVSLQHYLIFSAILFGISIAGVVINRKNFVTLLMCIELMLLSVNTNFVAFSHFKQQLDGQVFVFFVLTVAAAEAAIGLALAILLYRGRGSVEVDAVATLKG